MSFNDIRIGAHRSTTPGAAGQTKAAGSLNGRPVDVDETGWENRLRSAQLGRHAAGSAEAGKLALDQRQVSTRQPVRELPSAQLARHARLTGNEREVRRHALDTLRNRARAGQAMLSLRTLNRNTAMKQYLGKQMLQANLRKLQAARKEAERSEQAQQDFLANMAPVADFTGDASALARRFYEAMADEEGEFDELLSGFDLDSRGRDELKNALRELATEEDDQARHKRSYPRRGFTEVLARAMGLPRQPFEDGTAGEHEIGNLLSQVGDDLAQMESDPEVGPYIAGTINIADEAERQADPVAFASEYDGLVRGEGSWAEKCLQAAKMYVKPRTDGTLDLKGVQANMLAAGAAAGLDFSSLERSAAKDLLWAAMQSTKMIARLSTAISLADEISRFMGRYFKKPIDGGKMLQQLLERMANPGAPPMAFDDMARELGVGEDQMPTTLREASAFFRRMYDMYPDPQTRQILLENVGMALDAAAEREDQRMEEDQRAESDLPPLSAQPELKPPSAGLGDMIDWTRP
ncbi:MAG: hypothetical protein JWP36_2343 [Paucimonas sp.]|nr:hypothetical protein [Paucimonas sp.]